MVNPTCFSAPIFCTYCCCWSCCFGCCCCCRGGDSCFICVFVFRFVSSVCPCCCCSGCQCCCDSCCLAVRGGVVARLILFVVCSFGWLVCRLLASCFVCLSVCVFFCWVGVFLNYCSILQQQWSLMILVYMLVVVSSLVPAGWRVFCFFVTVALACCSFCCCEASLSKASTMVHASAWMIFMPWRLTRNLSASMELWWNAWHSDHGHGGGSQCSRSWLPMFWRQLLRRLTRQNSSANTSTDEHRTFLW